MDHHHTTPVIIEAAINGFTTKTVNPNVPITAEEIAAEADIAFDAGAAVVHAHCNPIHGPADVVARRYLNAFEPVWAHRPGALLYPTLNLRVEDISTVSFEHLALMAPHGLRLGLLDPGSLNLGPRNSDGLPAGNFVYANSFDTIAQGIALHTEHRLGISLAIYEPGFLRTALEFERAGRLPPGTMIKFYFSTERGLLGAPFGLPPTPTALDAYLELLGDSSLPWAVSLVGGDICRSDIAPAALERGGHLHLGLEFFAGNRTPTNAELIAEAIELCANAQRPVATHHDAVRLLNLPPTT